MGRMARLISALVFPFRLYWLSISDIFAYPLFSALSKTSRVLSLVVWYALFSLVLTVNFAWRILPQWQAGWQKNWQDLRQNWPEDLVVEYRQGKLSVTPQQVVLLPYPAPLDDRAGEPANLARIDTSAEAENPGDSLLFIQGETITAQSSLPLTEVLGTTDWRLTKVDLEYLDASVLEGISVLGRGLVAAHFILAWLALLLVRLLGLLLYAWLGQTFFWLTGLRWSYRKVYGVGLVALLPAETVQLLVNLLYQEKALPLFWWAWLAIMGAVAWGNRKT